MDRYLVQKQINNRWCNFAYFNELQAAMLCVKLMKDTKTRVLDRISKKYLE